MKEVLVKVIDAAVQKFGANYAEARAQKLFKTMLTVKDGRVEAAKQGIENGTALRVLVDGAWGFATVGKFDVETLVDAVSDACRMAKTASSRLKEPIKLVETKAFEGVVKSKPRKNPSRISMEDKIKMDVVHEQHCFEL